ncbi:MAG: hypothetical protein EAZ65_07265 [Verrucomicrobia bacterium]|nr:MAG: hypothetical protein EAZ84_00355 [Verrucomicrobiota bacterium]TAE87174.1 MAG: hypothetical protein EAZ82_08930 [Verrucomicrobiota bacterium]TAF24978.1 MAG: hypothetical protein EAZ71_09155 [Verrucomicrobiota bacterium]TAF40695.1 MAG: hypothetical protein EAZ65_07265 [Verrucomicrobiota bacterium]
MTPSRFVAIALLALCPGFPALAGGKKDGKSGISFHLQADPTDNPKMIFAQMTNGQQVFYRRSPEVMTKDISAFAPFDSEDGEGFGTLLQLKSPARNRLAATTNANVNRWLLAMVNGRVVDAVIIDKQIDDGQMVIWKGIGQSEIDAFDAQVPRIGEKKPRR